MSSIRTWSLFLLAVAVAGGCGAGAGAETDPANERANDPIDPTCPRAPPGLSTAPTTILDAVGMANALLAAQPAGSPSLSLACFVLRLSRPLTALGAQSVFSLQPAVGVRSPRIFIFSGPLVMSVAPAGSGRDLLELAEYPSPLRSIKAEMPFPLTAPLPPNEPFDRIHNGSGTGTVCGSCHGGEEQSTRLTFTKVYESIVFKPRARDEVSLPYMREQARTCDRQQEPFRCALLSALFERGDVLTGAFAPEAPTIFD